MTSLRSMACTISSAICRLARRRPSFRVPCRSRKKRPRPRRLAISWASCRRAMIASGASPWCGGRMAPMVTLTGSWPSPAESRASRISEMSRSPNAPRASTDVSVRRMANLLPEKRSSRSALESCWRSRPASATRSRSAVSKPKRSLIRPRSSSPTSSSAQRACGPKGRVPRASVRCRRVRAPVSGSAVPPGITGARRGRISSVPTACSGWPSLPARQRPWSWTRKAAGVPSIAGRTSAS